MSKIYTKTGDKGMSSLYDGRRISKSDIRFEALGDIDELNASLGISLRELIELSYKVYRVGDMKKYHNIWHLNEEIKEIQNSLFDIGASVATTRNDEKLNKVKFNENKILILEQLIDNWTDELEPLRNFILPNDNLHLTRAICRRAERHIVQLITPIIYTETERAPLTSTQTRPITESSTATETSQLMSTQPPPIISSVQDSSQLTPTETISQSRQVTETSTVSVSGKLEPKETLSQSRPVTESSTVMESSQLEPTQTISQSRPVTETSTVMETNRLEPTQTLSQPGADPNIIIYINRLSDYLFTIARVKAELFEEKALCIWAK